MWSEQEGGRLKGPSLYTPSPFWLEVLDRCIKAWVLTIHLIVAVVFMLWVNQGCPELQWGSESRGVSMTYVHMQAFFHSFNSQHSLTVVYCLYFFPHNTLNSFYWYLYPVNLKGKPNSAWDQTNIIWSYDTSFFKSSERNCTDTTTMCSTEEIKPLVHTKVQPPTGRRANHCLG